MMIGVIGRGWYDKAESRWQLKPDLKLSTSLRGLVLDADRFCRNGSLSASYADLRVWSLTAAESSLVEGHISTTSEAAGLKV